MSLEYNENGSIKLPQPEEITRREREDAAGSYIMMFSGLYLPIPLSEVVMSIAYYLYFKKKSRFTAFHSYQSLITQLPMSFFNTVLTVWVIINAVEYFSKKTTTGFQNYIFIIFIIFVVLWNLIYIVFSFIGYFKAGKGKLYYIPLFGKFAYTKFFGPNAKDYTPKEKSVDVNTPPKGF
jgi:uncharacterized Tic20 family protein